MSQTSIMQIIASPLATDCAQWIGCALAITGSILISLRVRISFLGFWAYLGSNLSWLVFGIATHAPGLVVTQSVFLITSLIGIARWKPASRSPLNLTKGA